MKNYCTQLGLWIQRHALTWIELLPPSDGDDVHKVGGECWGLNKVKDDWNGIRYCAQELQSESNSHKINSIQFKLQ